MQVSNQSNHFENYMIRVEDIKEIKLLDVIPIEDLECPVSKTLMTDPREIIPCHHLVNYDEIIKWYGEKKRKICPHCSENYISIRVNKLFANLLTKLNVKIQQPQDQLKKQINELYKNLPKTNQVTHAIEQFLAGEIKKGIELIAHIITMSSEGEQYSVIFDLMNEHLVNISNSSVQGNHAGNDMQQLKEIKLVDVFPIEDLECPISKTLMTDPLQIIPCGHYINQNEIIKWYREKKRKVCPHCTQDYTSTCVNTIFKKLLKNLVTKIHQPKDQLRQQIDELCRNIPKTRQLQDALETFFAGQINEGLELLIHIITAHSNGELYSPIFNLMDEYVARVANRKVTLIGSYNKQLSSVSLVQDKATTTKTNTLITSGRGSISNTSPVFQSPKEIPPTIRPPVINSLSGSILLTDARSSLGNSVPLNSQANNNMRTVQVANKPMQDATEGIFQPINSTNIIDLESFINGEESSRSKQSLKRSSPPPDSTLEPQAKRSANIRWFFSANKANGSEPESTQEDHEVIDQEVIETEEYENQNADQPHAFEYENNDPLEIEARDENAMETVQEVNKAGMEDDSIAAQLMKEIKKKRGLQLHNYIKSITDINVQDREGNSLMHLIISYFKASSKLVETLIRKGANINVQNLAGETPLYQAAKIANIHTINTLLAQGASRQIADNQGLYPKDVSPNYGDQILLRF